MSEAQPQTSLGAALSEVHQPSANQPRASQYLTFLLAGEEYGVEILRVQGIQGLQAFTAIPNTPDYLLGVMNLRGAIVPVMDLRVRFGLPTIERTKTTVVVVVKVSCGAESRTVGMVVDAVSEVYAIDEDNCQRAPNVGAVIDLDFIRGLATVDEKMVILLEIDSLINDGFLNCDAAGTKDNDEEVAG